MTEPFLGEVQIFGFTFAPKNWALCNGALITIQQNPALYSLIGANFGGNGTINFALPNLDGQAVCGQGNGPAGLSPRTMGETFGDTTVLLTTDTMPAHTHVANAYGGRIGSGQKDQTPVANANFNQPVTSMFTPNLAPTTTFAPDMIGPILNNAVPHENRQPALALNYCIAMAGAFPSFD